ncbi:MAG: ABC transporter ATP-binding protein [Rhodospirillales bacterium]
MTQPLLQVRDLTVAFAVEQEWRPVVMEVGFDLMAGEVLGIVGESGSGKTVTSRALISLLPAGVSRVMQGTITFEGQDLLTLPPAALQEIRGGRIGMVFQNPTSHLDPVMRIGQQIAVGLTLHKGMERRAARRRTIALLDEVGFSDPERQVDAFPHELSGGMRQRAMIAAALSCDPGLLIADEPTTALDVTVQAQIIELLRDLQRRRGLSIVFISHDLGLVADFCDRVVVMERGRIVETAPVAEIVARPRHPYTVKLLSSQPGLIAPGRYFPLEGQDAEPDPPPEEAPPGPPCLEVAALGVSFAQKRNLADLLLRKPATRFAAVDGVDLTLRRGEAFGLVGESGSGKSTLARSVVGLVDPSGGEIRLDGEALHAKSKEETLAWRRKVQMIFQDPLSSLNPKMSVAETLSEPLRVHALCPAGEIPARVASLMHEVGLDAELAERKPHQLSGGQCQRVGIARALAMEPELLLADEPTSALDVTIQAQILNLLMHLRHSRGLTMLFISHDLAVVRHLCQTIAVMKQGKVVETGSVADIFERPRHDYTRRLLSAVPAVAKTS